MTYMFYYCVILISTSLKKAKLSSFFLPPGLQKDSKTNTETLSHDILMAYQVGVVRILNKYIEQTIVIYSYILIFILVFVQC